MWDDGSTAARAAVCSANLSSPAAILVRPASLCLLDSMRPLDFDFRFQRFDNRRRSGGGDSDATILNIAPVRSFSFHCEMV